MGMDNARRERCLTSYILWPRRRCTNKQLISDEEHDKRKKTTKERREKKE